MIEKLLIATNNPAKFDTYKKIINTYFNNIEVFSLKDFNINNKVEEKKKVKK